MRILGTGSYAPQKYHQQSESHPMKNKERII